MLPFMIEKLTKSIKAAKKGPDVRRKKTQRMQPKVLVGKVRRGVKT